MDLAVRTRDLGSCDLVEKTSGTDLVRPSIANTLERSEASLDSGTAPLLGASQLMRELRAMIRDVASTNATVLIAGESGTGKELVARAIHKCSDRRSEEFVPVNMAALPDSLVESVLFGHEKGAFTGADSRQLGLCQQAHGGTLFLDEISEMQRDLQPKLLRFLQEYTYQRVGSTRTERADVRIVSATNRNPAEMVQSGCFREDLYFRLNVIPIEVPPLRKRAEDIPLLVRAFVRSTTRRTGRRASFSPALLRRLQEFDWPGNVRQLQNLVERMVILARSDVLTEDQLPPEFCHSAGVRSADSVSGDSLSNGLSRTGQRLNSGELRRRATDDPPRLPAEVPKNCSPAVAASPSFSLATMELEPVFVGDRSLTRMELIERTLIIDALRVHSGNVSAAAKFLGLGPATVYRKIRSYQIPGCARIA